MRIFLLLFLFPFLSSAQQKGNTKIIVSITDTSNMLTRLTTHFYERGYLIELEDKTAALVETEKKQLTKLKVYYKITAMIKDNSIVFSCVANLPSPDNDFNPVKYGGSKNALNMQVWTAMEEIAREFGSNLTFR